MNRSANIVGICCLVVISCGLIYFLNWRHEQERMMAIRYKKYGLLDLKNIASFLQIEFKRSDSELVAWNSDIAENSHLSVVNLIGKKTEDLFFSRENLQDENKLDYLIKKKDGRFIVWGVGLNKIDEGGSGDDLCISFEITK